MAVITLSSFFTEPLGKTGQSGPVVQVPSIQIPGKKPGPPGRVIMLYGIKDALATLQKARQEAHKNGRVLIRVDADVEIGKPMVGKLDLTDLETTRILNVSRLIAATSEAVAETILAPGEPYSDPGTLLGNDPRRLDQIFNSPAFSDIAVIVWPAPLPNLRLPDGRPKTIQLAAVRSANLIQNPIVRNYDGEIKTIKFEEIR